MVAHTMQAGCRLSDSVQAGQPLAAFRPSGAPLPAALKWSFSVIQVVS